MFGYVCVFSVFQINENELELSWKLFGEINDVLYIVLGWFDKQLDEELSCLLVFFYFLRNVFDWQFFVLIWLLKYGIVLFVVDMFVFIFGFVCFYWILVLVVVVMFGIIVVFMFYRVIQCLVGIVIGVGLVGVILFVKLGGVYIVLCIVVL